MHLIVIVLLCSIIYEACPALLALATTPGLALALGLAGACPATVAVILFRCFLISLLLEVLVII